MHVIERFARRRGFLNQRGFLSVKQGCARVRAHDARPKSTASFLSNSTLPRESSNIGG